MGEQLEKFEALLEDMRKRLERIEAKLGPEPTCLTYPDAAKRLGVGLTKLKALVKAGEVRTTRVGKVPMVPMAEILRVATPSEEPSRPARRARAAVNQDPRALDALLKRRR